jgi:hypothetical protein
VTIAKRPFVWAGTADGVEVIWLKSEPKYFCEKDWTSKRLICLSGEPAEFAEIGLIKIGLI